MSKYVIYSSQPFNQFIIHNETCDKLANRRKTMATDSYWQDGFESVEEAIKFADELGKTAVICNSCIERDAEFNKISEILFRNLNELLASHKGLSIFSRERAKFEGWLKVEICGILSKYFDYVVPERQRIDVTFNDEWAIELKTINTNYADPNALPKKKPITKNAESVIKDVEKLKNIDFKKKAVLFVVFPVTHNTSKWKKQLEKIESKLKELRYCPFSFENKVNGVIYFGRVQ